MLDKINLEDGLIFDIETVPVAGDFHELPETFKGLWELKASRYMEEDENIEDNYFERAGIYAEFGKIICISAGFFVKSAVPGMLNFRIRSFWAPEEKVLLRNFKELLDQYYSDPQRSFLCGHNIKEFDVPYVCRRMLVNGITLPTTLDIFGKKPWEVNHVDTMQLWKFGDFKSYTSLKLLAALFDIPTPKDDIDGSDVASVYWKDQDLDRIVTYCQKDVLTVAQLLLRFKGLPTLKEEDVTVVGG